MTDDRSPAEIDTSVPHSARIWNYWLGGTDNYAVDREAGEAGMRQFLDIGTGLPTADNTHQVAQQLAPQSRVVYVDDDPLVVAHARFLLTSRPEGAAEFLDADIRNPAAILGAAAGHFTDDEAYPIVASLLAGLPSGSYFALYDGADTNEAFNAAQQGHNDSGAVPYYLRSPERFAPFFAGLGLVAPGIAPVQDWRPDSGSSGPAEVYSYRCVARKP